MANTHGVTDILREVGAHFKDIAQGGFIVSGGLFAVPAASITLAAVATKGYVVNAGELRYVSQDARAITLATAAGVYWIILHKDTSNTVAGWTRIVGSNYLYQVNATVPTVPGGATLLASATVAANIINAVADYRTPASMVRMGYHDITDPLYGAIGDGVTDAASALEGALASVPGGVRVYVPPGTFVLSRNVFVTRGDVTLQGSGFASIIKAKAGFINTGNKGLVSFGYSPALGLTAINNVTVRDLTLDGNSLAKALEFLYVTRGTISHIQALHGGVTHPIVHTETTTDLLIENSTVSGALGLFGDGIHMGGAIRPRIINNIVSDFTRIGIVAEEDSAATNSKDVLIQGNRIFNAHDASATEYNAAIWIENTDGGQIIGNIGENLNNTPGPNPSAGIVLSIGGASGSEFQVIGNSMSGAQTGLYINLTETNNVYVSQFSMKRGTIANYSRGVWVRRGFNVHLSGLQLGANAFQDAGSGSVVVDLLAEMNELSISDSGVAGPTGMVYTVIDSADINIASLNPFILSSLYLHNLQNWKMQMRHLCSYITISDCGLKYDDDTYEMLAALIQIKVSNSTITTNSGSGGKFLRTSPGAIVSFLNVQFISVHALVSQTNAAGLYYIFLQNCQGFSSSFTFTGYFYVALDGLYWNEYPVGGAFVGNGANNTLHMRVRNTDFNRSTDDAPLNVSSFQPTTLVVMNVVRSSTSLGTMTPASTGYPVVDILP